MVEEKRRPSPRLRASPGSHVSYVEGAGAIRDLSVDGVFVLDPEPLPVGTEFKFSLRFRDQEIPLQGIVRRSVDEEGMGIEFAGISREARRQLRLHIASLS